MQRIEDEVLAGVGAPVAGDLLAAADDLHPVDIAANHHLAVAIGGRHRVIVAAITHQRERADPTRSLVARLVRHCGQLEQRRLISLARRAADRCVVPTQPISEAAAAEGFELRVQLLEGRRPWQWHQIVAPRIADQIFDLALVVALARPTKAILEQVVGRQLAEGAGPLPLAVAENPYHRQLGVSYKIERGTPPKNPNADTCPSRKASVVSAG